MTQQHHEALQLFRDLVDDLRDPNFVWQVVTLAACVGAAWLFARWWIGRHHQEGAGRLKDAGARLAFPLTAVALVGIARLVLQQFIHVNLFRLALPLLGSMALVRAVVFVLRQAFPKATWLTAWERIIATFIWGWLALYITDLAPDVIAVLEDVVFPLGAQRLNLWMVLQGIVTVFFTVVAALWVSGLVEARLMRMDGVDSSLRIVGVRVAKTLLTVAALVTGLTLVGIDMTAFSVFTGALGVGLGLGMQRIASNYVSGFIILLDRSIHIGDVVQVSGTGGQVSKITTRYTVLKNTGGVEFIVPNEALISNVVQNQSYSDTRVRVATTVGVTSDTDLDLAMRLMAEAASGHRRILADPAPKVLLTTFGDGSVQLELGFWIADPEAGKGGVTSDVNIAIWRAFRDHGIEISFPQPGA
ncbi:MAG: mechanosensitive ion channel [Dechloromonas sp.]|jgi:small-conductance mechanosensitive channel|nr:mechanosensitive ion channel [Dechloromonas sp.]